MKILFDQNISFRVITRLQDHFPDCGQVRALGLENRSDREIWEFAKKEDYAIVSFDADFYDLLTLYGHPPKLIWLRTGNTRTENLINLMTRHNEIIKAFLSGENYQEVGCLEINS